MTEAIERSVANHGTRIPTPVTEAQRPAAALPPSSFSSIVFETSSERES